MAETDKKSLKEFVEKDRKRIEDDLVLSLRQGIGKRFPELVNYPIRVDTGISLESYYKKLYLVWVEDVSLFVESKYYPTPTIYLAEQKTTWWGKKIWIKGKEVVRLADLPI